MAYRQSWRRHVIRMIARRFPGGAPLAVPIVVRWAKARVNATLRLRGIVRGTAVAWPYPGRAVAVADDVVRPSGDQILIRIAASAVSPGTERAQFTRAARSSSKFPAFPGYSAAGEVVAVGPRASAFRIGDLVALSSGHSSLACVPSSKVVPVPKGVAPEEAAFVQIGVIALQALERAGLGAGESMTVIGQGIIGQIIAQAAAARGHPVVSVARSGRRMNTALARRAHRVLVLDRDGASAFGDVSTKATFEVSGAPEAISMAIRSTAPGGRIVLAGSTRGMTTDADFGALADKEICVLGAHITRVSAADWQRLAAAFLDLLAAKLVDLEPLITARVHPLEAEWLYRRLARDDDASTGVVFVWSGLSSDERLRAVSLLSLPDLGALRGWRLPQLPISRRREVA